MRAAKPRSFVRWVPAFAGNALLALFLLILPGAASAESLYGLAMHGKAKYEPESLHLDYANPDAPKGGTLRMAGVGTFDTVNPFSIKGKAAEGLNLVYDRLMTRVWDEPFTLYPLIAERVDMPEDRSSITFHLNPKARFQDNSPITADDVIFSFQTLKKEGRPNMRRIYALVSKVEKPDAASVTFTLGPGHDRETVMILAMMPVLSKKWWGGKTFDSAILTPPLLSGPYKIATIDPGRRIVYARDPNYWAKDLMPNKGLFNFSRVVYDYYRDDTVAFEAFKAGALDLRKEMDAGKWASAYDFPAAKDGRVVLDAMPHGRPERTLGFIFNTRRPPFDDIRVRKALNLLFDFEWVNKNLFRGQYKRIDSYFPNSELSYLHSPRQVSSNSEGIGKETALSGPQTKRKNLLEADKLLREAGWIIKDGKRMKDGKPFGFEILLSAPEDKKIALNFKDALQKMGITANIRLLDSANYIGRINEYDFDMTLYYWLSTLSPGTEQALYWGCQAAKEKARWNFPGICDPEIDALAKKIAGSETREELVATARALDRKLMAGHYAIPLYYAGKDFVAYWKPLKRPEKTPLYGMVIETWWTGQANTPNLH